MSLTVFRLGAAELLERRPEAYTLLMGGPHIHDGAIERWTFLLITWPGLEAVIGMSVSESEPPLLWTGTRWACEADDLEPPEAHLVSRLRERFPSALSGWS